MKTLKDRIPQMKSSVDEAKIEAALKRFQANLAATLAIALFGLLALGSEMGSRQTLAGLAGFDGPAISPWVGLGAIIALVLLNALFQAAETALSTLKPVHIKFLKENHPQKAERLQHLMDGSIHDVAALSLASQLTKVLMIVLCFLIAPFALTVFQDRFGWGTNYTSLVGAMLIVMLPVGFVNLIFGELIPRSFASIHPTQIGVALYRVVKVTSFALYPLTVIVTGTANLFASRFGGRAGFVIANQAEEEIRTIVETAEVSGEIEQEEKDMLHSVFEFTDTIAREVMTPRVDLDAMPIRSDPTEVMNIIQQSGHSRIPLYEESDDQIVGIIHAKDLLMALLSGKAPNLRTLMRPALFVPENKPLHELLEELRRHRSQLAVVQDEFGGTAGIVTIEDIVEEIVGDIVDEYDVEEPEIQQVNGGWKVDGKAHVDDVNYKIGSKFESEEFDTIGGYVFGLFGRQPKVDESIVDNGFQFTVAESDGRRIVRLFVHAASAIDEQEALDIL